MDEAIQTQRLPPGLAAKLFGCLGFLNTGCFGKLGRSGLSSLKERQYSHDTALTENLYRSFTTIKSLLALKPERELPLQPGSQQRYLAASDAAHNKPRQGSAGLLFVGPHGERDAYVVDITAELFTLWSDHPTKIAQLELLTVYVGFIFVASQARSCQGLWFVDNIASLMALVKGRSDNPELDAMAGCIHALLYSLRSGCYFEWVQSADNWSDDISRKGIDDEWYQVHGFRVHRVPVPLLLLRFGIWSESDSSYLKSSVTDAAEYIHSFKVGRVGDEELFDVIQLASLLLSLGLKPKRSVAPQESGSLTLRIFLSHPPRPVLGPSGYRIMWQLSARVSTFAVHLSGVFTPVRCPPR